MPTAPEHSGNCGIDFSQAVPGTSYWIYQAGEELEDLHLGSTGTVRLCAFDIDLADAFYDPSVTALVTFYANTPANSLPGAVVAGPFSIVVPKALPGTVYHVETGEVQVPHDLWMGLKTPTQDVSVAWLGTDGDPAVGWSSDSSLYRPPVGYSVHNLYAVLYTRGCEPRALYGADAADNQTGLHRINASTGASTLIGDPVAAITGLAFHPRPVCSTVRPRRARSILRRSPPARW